jgi:hypothetical protein
VWKYLGLGNLGGKARSRQLFLPGRRCGGIYEENGKIRLPFIWPYRGRVGKGKESDKRNERGKKKFHAWGTQKCAQFADGRCTIDHMEVKREKGWLGKGPGTKYIFMRTMQTAGE